MPMRPTSPAPIPSRATAPICAGSGPNSKRSTRASRPTDQYRALLETSAYLRHLTRWLLAHRPRIRRSGAGRSRACSRCCANWRRSRPRHSRDWIVRAISSAAPATAGMGLPPRLAESLAALEPLQVAPDLVQLMRSAGAERARGSARALRTRRAARPRLAARRHRPAAGQRRLGQRGALPPAERLPGGAPALDRRGARTGAARPSRGAGAGAHAALERWSRCCATCGHWPRRIWRRSP